MSESPRRPTIGQAVPGSGRKSLSSVNRCSITRAAELVSPKPVLAKENYVSPTNGPAPSANVTNNHSNINNNNINNGPTKPAPIKRLSAAETDALKKLGVIELRKLAERSPSPSP